MIEQTISLPEEELHYVVCLALPVAAVEVACCNQIFCEMCVRRVDACPHCRSTPLRSRPSIVVRRLVERCSLLHFWTFAQFTVQSLTSDPTNFAEQIRFRLSFDCFTILYSFTSIASGSASSATTAAQWWRAGCSAGTRRPARAGRGTAARPAALSSVATSNSAWTTSCPNTGSISGAISSASPAQVRLANTYSKQKFCTFGKTWLEKNWIQRSIQLMNWWSLSKQIRSMYIYLNIRVYEKSK